MWEVWYNQEHIHKYPQILCQRWDYGFSHFVKFEVLNFRWWHCINFCDTMNCLINEKIKFCVNSLSSEQLLHIFNATSLVPSHIQDLDGLLLSRAADDLVVWVYAHCSMSVVISSVSVANLGCSQRHGKCKEECMAQGESDADDWIKILGILQKNVINY